ncbi:unnamed protein product [Oppiella nova]|uniref:Uncharacterized protein n=1 Tax=Oppiella nova TaxID=334625 RepID=A0A7R9M3Y6_9ACAR|nr:unnamed protein product [Oppiella nova]CAG2169807.1 unnamed protein product [Oppiella nova]
MIRYVKLIQLIRMQQASPIIIPPWDILLYNDSFTYEYSNDRKVDLYCTFPRTNYTTLYSIKIYKNTTILYSIDMTNNNGTECLATSRTRQMDSTIRLNQDHMVVTIPHPTDTTMGNYTCQYDYLDITHNYQLFYYTLMNICNKKSCDRLHQGVIPGHQQHIISDRKRDHYQDNYRYYESCVYSTNGSAQVRMHNVLLRTYNNVPVLHPYHCIREENRFSHFRIVAIDSQIRMNENTKSLNILDLNLQLTSILLNGCFNCQFCVIDSIFSFVEYVGDCMDRVDIHWPICWSDNVFSFDCLCLWFGSQSQSTSSFATHFGDNFVSIRGDRQSVLSVDELSLRHQFIGVTVHHFDTRSQDDSQRELLFECIT